MTTFVVYVMVAGMTDLGSTGETCKGHFIQRHFKCSHTAVVAIAVVLGLLGGGLQWLLWFLFNLYILPVILTGGVCMTD